MGRSFRKADHQWSTIIQGAYEGSPKVPLVHASLTPRSHTFPCRPKCSNILISSNYLLHRQVAADGERHAPRALCAIVCNDGTRTVSRPKSVRYWVKGKRGDRLGEMFALVRYRRNWTVCRHRAFEAVSSTTSKSESKHDRAFHFPRPIHATTSYADQGKAFVWHRPAEQTTSNDALHSPFASLTATPMPTVLLVFH